MFNNIGSKIKTIAVVFFTLEMIGVIISALASLFAGGAEGFIIGVIIFVVGFMCAYLSVMLIYAFGELVENSAIIASNTSGMSGSSRHPFMNSGSTIGGANQVPINPNSTGSSMHPLFRDEPPVKKDTTPDYWVCPNCGRANHKTAGTCGCGQRKTL